MVYLPGSWSVCSMIWRSFLRIPFLNVSVNIYIEKKRIILLHESSLKSVKKGGNSWNHFSQKKCKKVQFEPNQKDVDQGIGCTSIRTHTWYLKLYFLALYFVLFRLMPKYLWIWKIVSGPNFLGLVTYLCNKIYLLWCHAIWA